LENQLENQNSGLWTMYSIPGYDRSCWESVWLFWGMTMLFLMNADGTVTLFLPRS